jgi:hypothetical protein
MCFGLPNIAHFWLQGHCERDPALHRLSPESSSNVAGLTRRPLERANISRLRLECGS